MTASCDLAVIGAGSGGITAARFATRAGARVVLIEKDHIGGDCTWTGCVPSKALLKVARVAHQARNASGFGLSVTTVGPVDLREVMDYVRRSISEVYRFETPEVLRQEGVDVRIGRARFEDASTLAVASAEGGTTITAKKILLCAGARPTMPSVRGLSEVPYLTYEQVYDLEAQPEHLLVMGGGPVGVEMAQAFRRLGSRVSLFQGPARLLPRDEPEAAETLARILRDEGVELHLGERVTSVALDDSGVVARTGVGKARGDALPVATGRTPNVDTMDLARAGVKFTEGGVPVDGSLRTNIRHIYAAGDVVGGPQFTHYAGYQAFIAARNALFPGTSKVIAESVPWTTFTDPEVARAGLTETEARNKYRDGDVGVRFVPMERVDRAVTESDTEGFIKVVHKKDGTVVGATVVAERAGESIHEWALAISNKRKMSDLAGTIHVYPTYSIANQQLASAYSVESFLKSKVGKVLKKLGGLR
ncbi:MAG: FAD-dependent oxidoreductase [Actinomycetota bacterium]|nr:FAD-dependent oxidoreductase [Actinomycetota bacterium]